jgi:hypothetical protein
LFSRLAHQRREIGIAADDHEGVHVGLGVAEVERIDDHADISRVFSGLAHVRNFDQLEGGFVHGGLELLVALPVAVGLLDHDAAFEQQPLEHLADVELRVACVPHPDCHVLEIAKNGQVLGFRRFPHPILPDGMRLPGRCCPSA